MTLAIFLKLQVTQWRRSFAVPPPPIKVRESRFVVNQSEPAVFYLKILVSNHLKEKQFGRFLGIAAQGCRRKLLSVLLPQDFQDDNPYHPKLASLLAFNPVQGFAHPKGRATSEMAGETVEFWSDHMNAFRKHMVHPIGHVMTEDRKYKDIPKKQLPLSESTWHG